VVDEYAHLFSLQDDHEDLKIDFSTCRKYLKETAGMKLQT